MWSNLKSYVKLILLPYSFDESSINAISPPCICKPILGLAPLSCLLIFICVGNNDDHDHGDSDDHEKAVINFIEGF